MSKFSDNGNLLIRGLKPDQVEWVKKQTEDKQISRSALMRLLIRKEMIKDGK